MHKAGKSEKGYGFEVDNTIGRYIPSREAIISL